MSKIKGNTVEIESSLLTNRSNGVTNHNLSSTFFHQSLQESLNCSRRKQNSPKRYDITRMDLISEKTNDTDDDELDVESDRESADIEKSSLIFKDIGPVDNTIQIKSVDSVIEPLVLPTSSVDLSIDNKHILSAAINYEVFRRFNTFLPLIPFHFDDYCDALADKNPLLLAEIHIVLLNMLLLHDDFGGIEFKGLNSYTIFSFKIIDKFTWPEILRLYLSTNKRSDQTKLNQIVLNKLANENYQCLGTGQRLSILKLLVNKFLPKKVRGKCPICRKSNELIKCKLCSAQFHLNCMQPSGSKPNHINQCVLCNLQPFLREIELTENGTSIQSECLGYDRHKRQFWYFGSRIIVQCKQTQKIWYYSSKQQFKELLGKLKKSDCMEAELYSKMVKHQAEIEQQMTITESFTAQSHDKQPMKTYIDNFVPYRTPKSYQLDTQQLPPIIVKMENDFKDKLNTDVKALRQELLKFEERVTIPFMHPNWKLLRAKWIAAIKACHSPADFVCGLSRLQICMKNCIFVAKWNEMTFSCDKPIRTTLNKQGKCKKPTKKADIVESGWMWISPARRKHSQIYQGNSIEPHTIAAVFEVDKPIGPNKPGAPKYPLKRALILDRHVYDHIQKYPQKWAELNGLREIPMERNTIERDLDRLHVSGALIVNSQRLIYPKVGQNMIGHNLLPRRQELQGMHKYRYTSISNLPTETSNLNEKPAAKQITHAKYESRQAKGEGQSSAFCEKEFAELKRIFITQFHMEKKSPEYNENEFINKFKIKPGERESNAKSKKTKEITSNEYEGAFKDKSTRDKIYLPHFPKNTDSSIPITIKPLKAPLKYPSPNRFLTKNGVRSMCVLPKHELTKLARCARNMNINGWFNQTQDKSPIASELLPCPLLNTCWQFHTMNAKTLAAVALQLRILKTCVKWGKMYTAPPKKTIKYDDEHPTFLCKMRISGRYSEKVEYFVQYTKITNGRNNPHLNTNNSERVLRQRNNQNINYGWVVREPEKKWLNEDDIEDLWQIMKWSKEKDIEIVRDTWYQIAWYEKAVGFESIDVLNKHITETQKGQGESIK